MSMQQITPQAAAVKDAIVEEERHIAEHAQTIQELDGASMRTDSPISDGYETKGQMKRHASGSDELKGSPRVSLSAHRHGQAPNSPVTLEDVTNTDGLGLNQNMLNSQARSHSLSQARLTSASAGSTETSYLPAAEVIEIRTSHRPVQQFGHQHESSDVSHAAAAEHLRLLNRQADTIIQQQKQHEQQQVKASNASSDPALLFRELLETRYLAGPMLLAGLDALEDSGTLAASQGQMLDSSRQVPAPCQPDAPRASALQTGDSDNQASTNVSSSAEGPRLVACTLMKNEVPYLVEWIEFHRLVGFAHIALWDDGSHDNAHLIERLYQQHGRGYISYDRQPEYDGDFVAQDDFQGHARMRRVLAAGNCLLKYQHLADWVVHLDIDEFVWSPRHRNLRTFFQKGVPADMHVLYAGATRFGWEHMRHRHTYTLEEVALEDGSSEVQMLNPNGVQLLTQSHHHRAPDKRLGEPEEILKDSNDNCRMWKSSLGRMSPCMNDADGQYGKTFIRAVHATGLWTHGGSVHGDFGQVQADDGTSFESDIFTEPKCPKPTCGRGDPTDIHIYHFRSPSLEDDIKKAEDWHWKEHPEEGLQVSDEDYQAGTWFYNLVRDVSLLQFSDALAERISPLLTRPVNESRHAERGVPT